MIYSVTSAASLNETGNLYSGAKRYSTDIQIVEVMLINQENDTLRKENTDLFFRLLS